MYRNILVPIDGSAASRRGLQEAVRIAKAANAALRIVTIINDTNISTDYISGPFYDRMIAAMRESGAKVVKDAADVALAGGVKAEAKAIEVTGGRVADEIISQAKNWPADLIVMGTHGRRGLSRLVMGSDAELVLRSSPVPVLMVRDAPEST